MDSCPVCPEPPDDPCGGDEGGCETGICDGGGSSEGGGDGEGCPESLSFKFFLGQRGFGKDAGRLEIHAKEPHTDMATPAGLRYSKGRSHAPNDVQLIENGNGDLRQVKTPQLLADIVTVTAYKYEIRFYNPDNIGSWTGTVYDQTSQTAFAVWTVENPDGASAFNRLYISQSVEGNCTKEYRFAYTAGTKTWAMEAGDCSGTFAVLKKVERSSVFSGNTRTDTIKTYEGAQLIRQSVQTWQDLGWGHVLTASETGTGANKIEVSRAWYTSSGQTGKYKKLKSWTNPDGSWAMRGYDAQGRVTVEVRSWKDTAMPGTVDPDTAHAIVNDYTPISGTNDDGSLFPNKPRTVTEKIGGTVVSKTFHVYYEDTANQRIVEIVERAAAPASGYGATGNLRTTSAYYLPGANNIARRHLASVARPDGTVDVYTWATGTYTPATTNGAPSPGTFTPGTGSTDTDVRTVIEHQGPSGLVNGKSTKEIIIRNQVDQTLLHETYAYDSGYSASPVEWVAYAYDARGRKTDEGRSNNAHIETAYYDCCRASSITDTFGIVTAFEYDALGRLAKRIKNGFEQDGSDDIVTQITRAGNAMGLLVTEITRDGASTLTLTATRQYDTAGRVAEEVDHAGIARNYTYAQTAAGGMKATETLSGTSITIIRESWLDGTLKNVTGTGVVHSYHDNGVNQDGTRWTKVYTGHTSGGTVENSPQWIKTTVNVLGQSIEEQRPGYNGSTVTTSYEYNDLGQLISMSTTGQADTLYEYDDLGNMVRSGLDVDGNDALDLEGTDRITETETTYELINSAWWRQTARRVYATDNDDTATTEQTSRQRLTGFGTGVTNEIVALDVNGNATTTTVVVDRSAREVTTTVDYPDSGTDEVRVTVNGLLTSHTSKTGLETTYAYDELGRQTGVTDPRTGMSETHYNSLGQVDWIEDADDNRTSYTYDPDTGRLASITNADNKTQYFSYSDRGEEVRTWGHTPYPVEQVYDDFGRRTQMKTFRGGSGWEGPGWPENPGTADVTTWVYDPATGLLVRKEYADGKGTNYAYTADGKLATRTWERGVTTTYGYDDATGELLSVDYSDATPDVSFTYDRLGRQATVSDAVGTRTFAYRDTLDLQLDTETIDGSGGGLYSKVITRKYATTGVPGRGTGFQVGTTQDPDADYDVTYDYDAAGRLNKVVGPGLPATYGVVYERVANSELIGQVKYMSGASTVAAYLARTYEGSRDVLDKVENYRSGSLVSKYDYTTDTVGRRTQVAYSGPAFDTQSVVGKLVRTEWGYNDRNEVIDADQYRYTVQEYPFGSTAYAYDPIGNRKSYEQMSGTSYYCANAVNQYTTRDNTQNCPPSAPVDETFSYDDDGNMTADATISYTWDGENRLASAVPTSPTTGSKKLEFVYDYMNRRVQKKVYTYNGSVWNLTSTERYVYDGWNVVLTLDGNNAVTRKLTWGLDLSGTLHGAGGIGGLLAVKQGSTSYWYFYDGNGNVTEVLQPPTGFTILSGGGGGPPSYVLAHYEYDPYGNCLYPTPSGSYAATNPIRFSTKWLDNDLGSGKEMYNFGRRPYWTRLGRWGRRDPMMEEGGQNLYVLLTNNPINWIDPHGLSALGDCKYQCGGCWQQCRDSGEDPGECEHRRIGCHYACENYGNPGSECASAPLPPPPGTPMPPPATIPWYVGGNCGCADILECMGRCLEELKAAEVALGTSVAMLCGQETTIPKNICGVQLIPGMPGEYGRFITVCGGGINDRLPIPRSCKIYGNGIVKCVGRNPAAPLIIGGGVALGYEVYCAHKCYENRHAY
jgi:RHS repeat-associated protein